MGRPWKNNVCDPFQIDMICKGSRWSENMYYFIFPFTLLARNAHCIKLITLPTSRRIFLLFISARQDKFLSMLDATCNIHTVDILGLHIDPLVQKENSYRKNLLTCWSSSLSEAKWATIACMQPRRAHNVACEKTRLGKYDCFKDFIWMLLTHVHLLMD